MTISSFTPSPSQIAYLAGRIERANAVLFTGAGFSLDARNIQGHAFPSSRQLKQDLWNLCYPGQPLDDTTTLQSVYEVARLRHRNDLKRMLVESLTVDSTSLPEYYREYFELPWARIYTVNVDDLEQAAQRAFSLPRRIRPLSAVGAPVRGLSTGTGRDLDMIHLNGTLNDIPDGVTFSMPQYSMRLGYPDPAYAQLTAELLSTAFVFVGTSLDEPSLWQHIEVRRSRGPRGARELRPRSFLVLPTLDVARQDVLREYNVEWLPMNAQQFADKVLGALRPAATRGLSLLLTRTDGAISEAKDAPLVSELATNPTQHSEYLLGEEPIWADIQSERAIPRDCDDELWSTAVGLLDGPAPRGILVVTGTAGSGKSTSLMRVLLRLSSERGVPVRWVDRYSELSPRDIKISLEMTEKSEILGIDDADMYGTHLSSLLRELARLPSAPLVVIGIRSGKVDARLNPAVLGDVRIVEKTMPHLTDSDIDALLATLDRENRLGVLKGQALAAQRQAFRERSGRQLLVAMIEATSNLRFEEKVLEEFNDLSDDARLIYAVVATATSNRFNLNRDEILLATGAPSNALLNELDGLVRRRIIIEHPKGGLQARHRRIAEILVDELAKAGLLHDPIRGLAFLGATKVSPVLPRNSRPWRLLRQILNHGFLTRTIGVDLARSVYGFVEDILHWDYHFWLQRGSLEVELGTLSEAENFLNQSRSLSADDPLVETEWAYLLFRKAIENPRARDAISLVEEAVEVLRDLTESRGKYDPYPYHVLGSQGLAWARRGIPTKLARQEFLGGLLDLLQEGCRRHPLSEELSKLAEDLKRERLLTVVSDAGTSNT